MDVRSVRIGNHNGQTLDKFAISGTPIGTSSKFLAFRAMHWDWFLELEFDKGCRRRDCRSRKRGGL